MAVPCDVAAQWEFGVSVEFPDGELPPEEAMVRDIVDACVALLDTRPDRTDGKMYVPNAESWAQGSHSAGCWLY